jgi:hypothetical protein
MTKWAVRLNLEIEEGLDEPLEVIQGIVDSSESIERSLGEWVRIARMRGHTWDEIGKALRVTRQSAWERFKELDVDTDAIIDSVVGSLKGRFTMTTEQMRDEFRREEREIEERKDREIFGDP